MQVPGAKIVASGFFCVWEGGIFISSIQVPVWEKANLTLDEAAAYSGIGKNKIRELSDDENCKFVLWVGTRRLIKRKIFDKYIEQQYSV